MNTSLLSCWINENQLTGSLSFLKAKTFKIQRDCKKKKIDNAVPLQQQWQTQIIQYHLNVKTLKYIMSHKYIQSFEGKRYTIILIDIKYIHIREYEKLIKQPNRRETYRHWRLKLFVMQIYGAFLSCSVIVCEMHV